MVKGVCKNCNKEKEVSSSGKSEGLCHTCYKRLLWKPKLIECKRCRRLMPHQAKGLCKGCYSSVFQLEQVKNWNARLYHNIEPELYKKVIEKCVCCDFNKAVELHHLDHNRKNGSPENLVGLCPNHHKLIHTKKYQKEVFDILKQKGYKVPEEGYATDGFYKKHLDSNHINP